MKTKKRKCICCYPNDDNYGHSMCGRAAEEYFMLAMVNVGFQEIKDTVFERDETGKKKAKKKAENKANMRKQHKKMDPSTFRRTTRGEEAQKKDFIVRLPGSYIKGSQVVLMPLIPIQLTLAWYENGYTLIDKIKASEAGKIALIWADERFGTGAQRHRNLFKLLRDAAEGQKEALKSFVELLKESCRNYLRKQNGITHEEIESALVLITV